MHLLQRTQAVNNHLGVQLCEEALIKLRTVNNYINPEPHIIYTWTKA
jgi:DNA transposition AAA+ family ATPase